MTGFRVDTKLFQELGELLVAKESTALVELIKNAYDADATIVTVTGTNLGDAELGSIVVSDDGTGMNADEFRRGFLTIAGRTKNTGDRRSLVFGRRYTGEKGVGRLASHKLGTALEVVSRKAGQTKRGTSAFSGPKTELRARIDWAAIERLETLDEIETSGAVRVQERPLEPVRARTGGSGTTLTIAPLRKPWSKRTRDRFFEEAATLAPHAATWESLPPGLPTSPLLFDRIPVRDQQNSDPGFQILFGGELSIADQVLSDLPHSATWVAELEFEKSTGRLRVAVAPTARTTRENPKAESFRFEKKLQINAGPSFRGRIFQKSGSRWPSQVQGIRVFMEGFRVPPYGNSADDWLGLYQTYKQRAARHLISLSSLDDLNLPRGLENEELQLQPNEAYMGAIFLHRSTSAGLEMLINREGFLPGHELSFIKEWTRVATDLIVRLGSLSRRGTKLERKDDSPRQREVASRADVNETPSALLVRENAIRAERGFNTIKQAVERKDFVTAAKEAAALQPTLTEVRELADQFGSEAVQWRVLASLGAELAAFVHEINSVGLQIGNLARDLEAASEISNVTKMRAAIRKSRQHALDLADRIRRNAAYLIDTTSFEGRRRRTRQPLKERFEAVRLFFESRANQKKISIRNEIEPALKTPPMFPSEVSGIFTNLLSNAVKFTNVGGRIRVTARESGGFLHVQLDNTGTSVDLPTAEKLFEAFRSTTERPDAVLGQGMGMGLTITRAFIQEYGGEIHFQKPPAGFATSILFSIPTR
ncbi:ATP-binding protein [Methylocystis sp. JR02]|uniref:sensor histidine kinase n=1 Tax=Methylocystis sp. JR02 TaxID=3046284 RepID=UPI0024B98C34|nr:ATP-binding protein [Methylocystis sp. JR02]MDJ0449263.1 ATP-binding protein [Methylocystis sp. JR02]